MILILTYIALICGGLLLVLLLLSIIGGLDLDLDVDSDGLGTMKSVLTFFSIGSWVVRLVLISEANPVLAFVVGAAAGAVGVYLLSLILKFLLSQQANVNWTVHDAIMEKGTVYLRIPAGGEGIVRVNVKGTKRELKARSVATEDIPTGAPIVVDEIGGDGIVVVSPA
ncbi:hypothetical protein FUA23_06090 [Neolewinella aurantiaca]|uniref:NfeD-like C-terminal domain-containing protein n=1 Tax=Neolewinella aurantiaca TaxID=2602767 RepID=A0A5C7FH32_9BACT|nr:hypothetical protein [Neolewinella aurantiaca]TXF90358.1 hypothetical protein FUA23_06090 [Neolewinella aurantiaca]